jgi:transcription elongation factor Elf1
MSQQEKLQRAEIYKDHLVQVLLSKFLNGEITKLEPVYDANGGYRYPSVEKIMGDPAIVDDFLSQLADAGILKRELYDRTIYCPNCGSARISMHYDCPYCKSFNVEKSALIEHVSCGYIDTEEKFRAGEKLVCPRCHKELVKADLDYKKAGVWCICHNCGKSFDIPVPSHFCRDCHFAFTFEDATFKDVYAYTLSVEAGKEASLGWIMANPIRQFLESRGYKVETPGFLKGKSGASHVFDVTAFRREGRREIVVVDVATAADDEVTEQPVIALFAKIYDVSPDQACLITIPRINENGKRMAKLYNINLIEAKNQTEAINGLRTVWGKALK